MRGKLNASLIKLHAKISKQCKINLKEFAGISHDKAMSYVFFTFKILWDNTTNTQKFTLIYCYNEI